MTDTDGGDIGWWDLVADAAHPTAPEAEVALRAAVKAWQAGTQAAPVVPETAAATAATVPINPDVVPHGPDFLPPDLPPAATDPLAAPVVADVQPVVKQFAPPQGPPVVDLAWNRPGEQLADKVAAARAAGERPTLWRRFWLGKNAYSTWERGAIGERLVAEELAKLVGRDSRWGFLNSIPISDEADIDLFVVGPGGVFTINAKYHRGARIWVGGDTLMVNGVKQPYVRNSRHEARKASRLLTRATGHPVIVHGIVVPVGANAFTVKAQPDDVHVINRARLTAYLRSCPEILHPPGRGAGLQRGPPQQHMASDSLTRTPGPLLSDPRLSRPRSARTPG